MVSQLLALAVCSLFLPALGAGFTCPPSNLLRHPCRCHSGTKRIVCLGNEIDPKSIASEEGPVDLNHMFWSLSIFLPQISGAVQWDLDYDKLVIEEIPDLESLGSEFFGKFTFRQIFIHKTNLSYISGKAFGEGSAAITRLDLSSNKISSLLPNKYSLFEAISKMPNLKNLNLRDNRLSVIPAKAFSGPKLTLISLGNNSISEIEDFAFSDLSNLKVLELAGNRISTIGENTLTLSEENKDKVIIHLGENPLTAASFSKNTFKDVETTLQLHFEYTGLKYLPRSVFKPLLLKNEKTTINLSNVECICNCSSQWLAQDTDTFNKQVLFFKCQDEGYVWDFDYESC